MTTGYIASAISIEAQGFRFNDVVVEGNQRIDARSVVTFAGIARGEALSAAQLNDAYQRVVGSGQFEAVEFDPRGGTLVIRVQEFPTINRIGFEGNRRLGDDILETIIRSQPRRVFSPAQAEADAAEITNAYFQSGRVAATVDPRVIRRSDNRVDLVFEIAEGRVVEIERIAFQGNRSFSDRRLRRVLETKQAGLLRLIIQSDTFIPDRIEFDKQLLRDFYSARGFVDFQVLSTTSEITRDRSGFFVTFTLREGQQFRFGRITTTSTLPEVDPEEFQRVIRVRPGVTYSPALVENTIARMENLALQKGLRFVRVEPRVTRNDRDLTLDVEFAVERGPRVFIERIDIEGNATTLDRVVRRQFRVVEGDPFNPREIRASAERIRALGFFSSTDVSAGPGTADDRVIIDVDLGEQPTGSLTFGLGYGVNQGVGATVSFSETNFLGRGQFVGITVDTSSSNARGGLNFREPAFLGRDLLFGLNLNYTEATAGSTNNTSYDTRTIAFRPLFEFPTGENSRLELRYRLADEKVSNVDPGSSRIVLNDEGALTTSAVGYTYSFDNRRTGLNPNAGVLLRFGQDLAGLGGDNEYVRTTALVSAERRIMNEEVTLRAELEGGALHMIRGNSRVVDRFVGSGRMRGFEPNGIGPRDFNVANQDGLGGNLFAVARFEAEFPLGLPDEYGISGGLFLDVGSIWGLDDTGGGPDGANPVDESFKIRSSVGFSVFWTTPLGPLRFNFSTPVKQQPGDLRQSFDLTVSTQF